MKIENIRNSRSGVSPVIAVILMVAITVVLAGVVFIWATSFSNQAHGGLSYDNINPVLTTTGGSHPEQSLTIEIQTGSLKWNNYFITIEEVLLNTSFDEDDAGDTEIFDVPDGDFPSGGIDLVRGNTYLLKIISIDYNRVIFNDMIICEYA